MDQSERRHIAMHAPNIVNICVDKYNDGEISGRIYHCYKKEESSFVNIIKLVEMVEGLFDRISFPQASTKVRSFKKKEEQQRRKEAAQKVTGIESVVSKRGELGTFLMHVKYRQNSSWQGELEWLEGEEVLDFVSVLEFIKILNNILDKVE